MHKQTTRSECNRHAQTGEGTSACASPNPSIATSCSSNGPMIVADRQSARLVIEAACTTCGRIGWDAKDGISIVRSALAHSAATAHVVILNGTTDLPESDQPLLFP